MNKPADPNQIIIAFATAGLFVVSFWRLLKWIRAAPVKPEPWSAEIEEILQRPDATPICHRCLTPHHVDSWFCKKCGAAIGIYNNWMPYVELFSEGEVLRNGVTDKLRTNSLTIVGYLFYSSANYFIFAPVYWFFFFKNLKRIKTEQLNQSSDEDK